MSEAAVVIKEILQDFKQGSRGQFKLKNLTKEQWGSIEDHLLLVLQSTNSNAGLNELQAACVVNTVAEICLANPVDQYGSSFKGVELLQIAAFINTCR